MDEFAPRTRGKQALENDDLWLGLFNLCEQQGRRWPEVKQALAELVEARNMEDVVAILLPILAYDPNVEVVNAAAVKDARRAIRTARDVLDHMEANLTGAVGKNVTAKRNGHAKAQRSTKYIPCPECRHDKAAQGMANHLRHEHGYTEEQVAEARARRYTRTQEAATV